MFARARAWHASLDPDARELLRFGRQLAQFLAGVYLFDGHVAHLSITRGPSMQPTLNEAGDVVLVDKLSCGAWGWDPITRGDVVVAGNARRTGGAVCKRVIALPGDEVTPPGGAAPVLVSAPQRHSVRAASPGGGRAPAGP